MESLQIGGRWGVVGLSRDGWAELVGKFVASACARAETLQLGLGILATFAVAPNMHSSRVDVG